MYEGLSEEEAEKKYQADLVSPNVQKRGYGQDVEIAVSAWPTSVGSRAATLEANIVEEAGVNTPGDAREALREVLAKMQQRFATLQSRVRPNWRCLQDRYIVRSSRDPGKGSPSRPGQP